MIRTLLLISLFFVAGQAQRAQAVCVKVDKANLRAKASAKSKVSWVVGKYTPLLEVGRKGAWMKVKDQDGKTHWIHRKLVTYGFKCAAIKASRANLRNGPGTKHRQTLLGSARKYAAFRKLDRDDAWLKLRDDYGYTHWAHESGVWEPLYRARMSF